MARGRPRKPVEQLKREGRFRKDRHGDRSEPVIDDVPTRPKTLTGEAKALWDEVVPALIKAGVARATDAPLLVSMCELWALYRAAHKVAVKWPTDKDARIAVTAYWAKFAAAAAVCGMSPEARSRVAVDAPKTGGVAARKR